MSAEAFAEDGKAVTQANVTFYEGLIDNVNFISNSITLKNKPTLLNFNKDTKIYVNEFINILKVKVGDCVRVYAPCTPESRQVEAAGITVWFTKSYNPDDTDSLIGFYKNKLILGSVTETSPELKVTTHGNVTFAVSVTPETTLTRMVVLWSDNAWHLGEKAITGKNSLWERSTHVPLIFAGPGVMRGVNCSQPAELLDIYPTLLELCGLPPRDGLEGHSLMPQLKDSHTRRLWPAVTTHNIGNHAVRTDHRRYNRYADNSEELYDMQADSHEWTNIVANPQFEGVVKDLSRWLPKVNTPPVPGSAERVLTQTNGVWYWEGKVIRSEEKVV